MSTAILVKEPSLHLARIYLFLKADPQRWSTTSDVAAGAEVAYRTANAHLKRLASADIVRREEMFGGYRYRLNIDALPELVTFLERAIAVFGLNVVP